MCACRNQLSQYSTNIYQISETTSSQPYIYSVINEMKEKTSRSEARVKRRIWQADSKISTETQEETVCTWWQSLPMSGKSPEPGIGWDATASPNEALKQSTRLVLWKMKYGPNADLQDFIFPCLYRIWKYIRVQQLISTEDSSFDIWLLALPTYYLCKFYPN